MNTITAMPAARALQPLQDALKGRLARLAPLGAIVAFHVLMFYLLQSGMLGKVAHAALPDIINISFITLPPPPPPKPAAPLAPKTVRLTAPQARAIAPPPRVVLAPADVSVAPAIAAPVAEAAPTPALALALAAPPAPAAVSAPRTVTSVEYIRAPQPVYPKSARRLGESGTVVLRILIGATGLPEQVTVQKSSGYASLDEAGRQAALRALFKPLTEDGKPVSAFVIVPLNFQLS
ncbi:protein TonB [Oxalobacteraceae bacterium GrIS 1.11]